MGLLQLANKAASSIRALVRASSEEAHQFAQLVLADNMMEDLYGFLTGDKQAGAASAEPHVKAIASVLAAVSAWALPAMGSSKDQTVQLHLLSWGPP